MANANATRAVLGNNPAVPEFVPYGHCHGAVLRPRWTVSISVEFPSQGQAGRENLGRRPFPLPTVVCCRIVG
jgi:hypothetical protein